MDKLSNVVDDRTVGVSDLASVTAHGSMIWGMKVKTSVTLEEDTVRAIDQLANGESNRSRVIETAVVEYIERRRRERRDARDLEILNRNAEEYAREMADVLAYQVEL